MLAQQRDLPDVIQDIVHHSGMLMHGFHVLTNKEELLVYSPVLRVPLQTACARYVYITNIHYIRNDTRHVDSPENPARVVDRISTFSAVCRAWHAAAPLAEGPQRVVPWLLLPTRDAPPSFFCFHSGTTRRMRLPDGVRGTRLCGAHDGGWVAVAADPWRGFAAVNLLTRRRLPLPEKLRLGPIDPPRFANNPQFFAGEFTRHTMLLRNVVFSAPPTSRDCVAAALVASASNIAFCEPAAISTHWITALAQRRDPPDVIQDIIHHSGALMQGFHVLTNKEELLVYSPVSRAPLQMAYARYSSLRPRDDYQADADLPATFVATRYLVESRGKLLMVVRHYTGNPVVRRCTRVFRVFELTPDAPPPATPNAGGAATPCSWIEIPELTGRALFVGRGCSRAVEVAPFGNIQEDTIYFLDDAKFDLSMVLNDESRYNADMGMYRKGEKISRPSARQFPREFTADCSPPIWLVP
uniref:KIB1-4 beta-propeller domain-containing protein n=1 Tax=Leersia perrieri TaxID=77586 RepID=A0A0D9V3R8_9ORYZ